MAWCLSLFNVVHEMDDQARGQRSANDRFDYFISIVGIGPDRYTAVGRGVFKQNGQERGISGSRWKKRPTDVGPIGSYFLDGKTLFSLVYMSRDIFSVVSSQYTRLLRKLRISNLPDWLEWLVTPIQVAFNHQTHNGLVPFQNLVSHILHHQGLNGMGPYWSFMAAVDHDW